ncbi:DNA-directed RNA polymerase subunit omega [Schleiferilactobacillus harbinensis]|jgi:DNA-directed RNA polymerase subunit omega|uniref:DNA-directed RNA polymerase subunit omega n=1 Tax=Schleiferilactobacillus harbinensis TaxID=304207 RepID=UPI001AAECDC5|nr:DNA-directed RNA polymerase subunit omega [Schleiferilactobacillus harbinensis]MBO3091051.1 DNA-directed RNA polymerase subunit omega [Schleiferilactobacillus harbinensis]
MISYPSIDDLLKRYDSRYSLAVLAAKRAHELEKGEPKMLASYESPKSAGQALEEIAKGKVIIDPDSVLLEQEAEKKLKKQEED